MVDQNTTTYSRSVSQLHESSGQINVPVRAQRELGICLDDELKVTIRDFDDEFVNEVSFTNRQTGGDTVTVPAALMRRLDLEESDTVQVSFEKIESDDDQSADDQSDLGQSQGAVESDTDDAGGAENDEIDEIIDDLFADDEEDEAEDEQEEEGLGELFG